jgi:hypothetical protein
MLKIVDFPEATIPRQIIKYIFPFLNFIFKISFSLKDVVLFSVSLSSSSSFDEFKLIFLISSKTISSLF